MLSLRTAASRVRTSTHRAATVRVCCPNLELPNNNTEEKHYSTYPPFSIIDHPKKPSAIHLFSLSTPFLHVRNLSSQADSKSTDKESELLEGFSDLEELIFEDDDGSEEEEENSSSEEEEKNSLEGEEELIEKKSISKKYRSPLFELISGLPRHSMDESLEKWVKEGNKMEQVEVFAALFELRKRRLFGKALQFMEWLEKSEHYEFTDIEFSSLLDFHAKMHGLYQAENFLEQIPQSMRTERVYRTLLASCVSVMHVPKAEKTFNRMQDLNFPVSSFACNQLLLLYKRTDRKKIADVLLMMEKENVKPTLFTYKILIDTKGLVRDIPGMDQLVETMKEDGIEPDIYIKYLIAKHYISGGLTKKAEKTIKEMEGGDISEKRVVRKFLLHLYAELGMPDEVERVWKVCEAKPLMEESIAVIHAWAKLGKVENAETVFDEVSKKFNKLSGRCCNSLLRVYADHKMVDKAKELVKLMSDAGFKIGPSTLDSLAKVYINTGDVAKADSMLQNWVQKNRNLQIRPMYSTYLILLEDYAKKGDYHNAEKVFHLMRQIGYTGRLRMYQLVLSAYVNAKVPAYGFRDRLKVDNIFPGKTLAEQLVAVDPFKKAPVTGLLE